MSVTFLHARERRKYSDIRPNDIKAESPVEAVFGASWAANVGAPPGACKVLIFFMAFSDGGWG